MLRLEITKGYQLFILVNGRRIRTEFADFIKHNQIEYYSGYN